MKYIIFSLLLLSNVAFASEDLKKELLTCVKETQQKALKVSKGMADYNRIIESLNNDQNVIDEYTVNKNIKEIKEGCADIFSNESGAHTTLYSIYSANIPFKDYKDKVIEEADSYLIYDISDKYYIFQKQDVTPVNVFIAIPKNKTPNNYKYNYDNHLADAYPLFVDTEKVKNNPQIFRRFYKLTGLIKVFDRSTKKVVSTALVIEPIILK